MTRYRNLLLGLVVAVAGCGGGSDDDASPTGPGLVNGTFTASIDGGVTVRPRRLLHPIQGRRW